MKYINKTLNSILALLLVASVTALSCVVNISSRQIKNINGQMESLLRNNAIIIDENEKLKDEALSCHKTIDNITKNKAYYVGKFKITYYDACMSCCGKTDGITASGAKVQDGITVAADTSVLPFGTKIYIDGIGVRIVQDRGGAIKGNKLDVYIPNCKGDTPYNLKNLNVWVIIE